MKIAVQGLGRMGIQIAERLVQDGHTVIAHNRSPEPIETAAGFGAIAAQSKHDVMSEFGDETPVIWIMLPAAIVEDQIREWLDMVPEHSVLIDGGNSDFRLTKKHAEIVRSKNCVFVDVGTSGGILGLENGFSMMVGGDKHGFEALEPALISLAKPHGGYHYFGDAGAGHYVKMVHNAIEYGVMESYAEGYRMLKEGAYDGLDLAAAAHVWQRGSIIESSLNALTSQALHENPELTDIEGYVAESGEARWTLEFAKEKSIPLPAIEAAYQFGGHAINKEL